MASLAFTVPGEVRGKGRPRIVKIGGFSRMKADDRTATYENLVMLAASDAMKAIGLGPLDGPLSVEIKARFVPPASASRKARQAMLLDLAPPAKKPDLDNIVKVLDALNGVAFRDDAQIVEIKARKTYDVTPGLDVVIRSYQPAPVLIAVEAGGCAPPVYVEVEAA